MRDNVIEWVDEEWVETLVGCPSQCFRRVRVDEHLYTLCLRWRWRDPWQLYILDGDYQDILKGKSAWRSIDLFREYDLFIRDVKLAERVAEIVLENYLMVRGICLRDEVRRHGELLRDSQDR